ncbi:MAG: hypothetical protein R6U29_10510 [Desulfosudaceae bacterium]
MVEMKLEHKNKQLKQMIGSGNQLWEKDIPKEEILKRGQSLNPEKLLIPGY